MNNTNQKQLFYSSGLSLASDNLRKMAKMQSEAGMHDLARDSLRQATARDHANDYYDNDPKRDMSSALDYGEFRVNARV